MHVFGVRNDDWYLNDVLSMLERCTEIEKANRILLEKMTSILAGPGANFPQNKKGYMPPIPHF